jgi:hypothetical protein
LCFFRASGFPLEAKDCGFTRNPISYESKGKFSANSGPKVRDESMTPLGALKCLIDDRVIQHVLNRAKVFNAEHNLDTKYTLSSFWRYFSAVIGHGVVQYSEERDAYVAEKSSISGLLSNNFLRSIHTFNEWQSAKQAFTGDREQLTLFFNEASENLWTPSQYVQNLSLRFLLL